MTRLSPPFSTCQNSIFLSKCSIMATSSTKPPLILLIMIIPPPLTHIILLVSTKHLFTLPCFLGGLREVSLEWTSWLGRRKTREGKQGKQGREECCLLSRYSNWLPDQYQVFRGSWAINETRLSYLKIAAKIFPKLSSHQKREPISLPLNPRWPYDPFATNGVLQR